MNKLLSSWRLWLPASYERRYRAALGILLSLYVFPRLGALDISRVDTELIEIYKPFGIYPWWRFRQDNLETNMAADRALAMWNLEIPTHVPGITWDNVMHKVHKGQPALLKLDFGPFDAATDEALRFLKQNGVVLSDEHFGKEWLDAARSRRS